MDILQLHNKGIFLKGSPQEGKPNQTNLFINARRSYPGHTDHTMLTKPVKVINLVHSCRNKFPHPLVSVKVGKLWEGSPELDLDPSATMQTGRGFYCRQLLSIKVRG